MSPPAPMDPTLTFWALKTGTSITCIPEPRWQLFQTPVNSDLGNCTNWTAMNCWILMKGEGDIWKPPFSVKSRRRVIVGFFSVNPYFFPPQRAKLQSEPKTCSLIMFRFPLLLNNNYLIIWPKHLAVTLQFYLKIWIFKSKVAPRSWSTRIHSH